MMTKTIVNRAPCSFFTGAFFLLIGFVLLALVLPGLLLLVFLFFDLVDIEVKLHNEE